MAAGDIVARGFTVDGAVLIDIPKEHIGKDFYADVIPPLGYRDAPDIDILGLKDGETREVQFVLEQMQAGVHLKVVDAAGNVVDVDNAEMLIRLK